MALFNRVTIVGLGLIGGSLGMAIRRKHLAREVIGLSRHSATIAQAKKRGAIDWGTTNFRQAVHEANVVVVATPVEIIIPYAMRLACAMPSGSILTDVGSTKQQIVTRLDRAVSGHIAFVGAHPLAGSEQSGLAAAQAQLFDGSTCILTRTRRTSPQALTRIRRLWNSLVRRVVIMDPQRHDRVLAAASHLPHLLAFSLVAATSAQARRLAPRSFLEATRVAQSDPDLWDDILLSNREALLAAISQFDRTWQQARHLVRSADQQALKRFLSHAHSIRQSL